MSHLFGWFSSPPEAALTPKTIDFQLNPKPPSAKPPSGNRRQKEENEERKGLLLAGWEQMWSSEHSCHYYWHKARRLPEGGLAEGAFGIWLKIDRFRGLGGSGMLLNQPKRWGASPLPLWRVLKPPGAAQTPKTIDFQPNPHPPSAKPPSGSF